MSKFPVGQETRATQIGKEFPITSQKNPRSYINLTNLAGTRLNLGITDVFTLQGLSTVAGTMLVCLGPDASYPAVQIRFLANQQFNSVIRATVREIWLVAVPGTMNLDVHNFEIYRG